MSGANLDGADLAAVEVGGLIREDVMEKIWELDITEVPLTSRIGSGSVGNAQFGWTQDSLAEPVIDDQKVDGEDTIDDDDTKTGARVHNFTETDTKTVKVSYRADASDTIGRASELAYQIGQRQKELRRDVEAISLSNNASRADDGAAVSGMTGGLDAWLTTNTSNGAGGSNGGFNLTTGIVDAYTPGTPRPIAEGVFKDLVQGVYEAGGEGMVIMSRPSVHRKFSEFQFSSGARVAALTRETAGDMGPTSSQTAVNVWIGDFATLEMVPNRLQQQVDDDVSTLFVLDPKLIEHAFLYGYRAEPLSKTGLADNYQLAADWGLRVGSEAGLAAFRDIDEAADMVAEAA